MTENKYLADGPLVVAIDSSTTSTKAIVVDAEGNIWHTAKQNIQLHTPAMDQYEHNPIRWWETSRATIGEVLSKLSPTDRSRIAAIGITHQRESFAPFDKEGRPLRNGILWLDGRATEQIRRYGSEHIHELSGKPAGVTPAIYKMAWVKEHETEIFADAYKVMDVHGYVAWMLTGRPVSSQAAADSLGLFDIQKRDWSDELLDIAGVSREQMADLVEPSYEMGTLRKELAEEWGIGEVPVIAGLGDGQAAGIGAAAVDPEIGFLNLGTAVNAGVDSPVYRYDKVFRTHVSGIPGNYVFVTLPYWNAVQSPHWDSVARGAVVGWRGTHSRAHMYRSILESIGFEMRYNLDSIEAGTGVKLTGLRAMGGGTRSLLWRQIMADTTALPITVCTQDEISALGAAVLAMASTVIYGEHDVAATAKKMAQYGETIEPDMEKHEQYCDVAKVQRKLYPKLKDVFEDLYELSRKSPSTKPESPKAEL